MEKRNFTRVKLNADVSLECDGSSLSGEVDDISLKGMYVRTSMLVPLSKPVRVTVTDYPYADIGLDARVIRLGGNGVGLEIHKMTVESFVRLRDLIMHQAADPDVVMNEVYKLVSCIV
ncbi:PilZ domain-containing protein [Geobacter argillaceus]|uniref:PilZ domain-containing protein n=1 Tax=Geobacter argillaceus TaxID=345631 RepID=A0A562VMT1_9BACT|nr:PilZ domain-containing protein [Geobacter argillaceus]TWJ19102.1 PilZ domain-containing protein [Geobacter argillaceus]